MCVTASAIQEENSPSNSCLQVFMHVTVEIPQSKNKSCIQGAA